MKGFVFTIDAIISLIIVGFAISIILYVNFSSLLIYQPSATEAYTILQNLIQTNLGSFNYRYAQYATEGWNAGTYSWPQFGNGQSLSSSSAYGPQIPGLLFSYAAATSIYKILAVGDGKVAFYSRTSLYAVNATSGNVIGGFPVQIHAPPVGSPVIYSNEFIYANASGSVGTIGAVSISNGNTLWSKSFSFRPTTQMAVENGYLTFGSGNSIYLINPFNGSVFASNTLPAPIQTPAYADGAYIIMTNNPSGQNYLYSYSLSGNYLSETWDVGTPSGVTTQPVIGDNVIAVGGGNILYVYTLGGNYITGYNPGSQIEGISIMGDKVYGQTATSIFYINPFPNDGIYYLQSNTLANSEKAAPSVTPATIYALTDDNYFQAYSPELRSTLWNITLPTTSHSEYSGIAIAYGNAYVASGNMLYAFGACKANPSASVLEDLVYMYLNGQGTCASMILSNFYKESDVGLFINNTYAPAVQGAQFNGASSHISTSAGIPSGSYSIFAWVYAQPSNQQFPSVFFRSGSPGLSIEGTGAAPYSSYVVRPCTVSCTVDSRPFSTNRWVMIGYTYSAATGNAIIYLNGVGGAPYSQAQTGSGKTDYIGSDGTSSFLFYGSIADVQLYSAALSAGEVGNLYSEGIGGAPVLTSNVVGWWPLDGNANDYSQNFNTGFPYNIYYKPTNAMPAGLSQSYIVNRYSVPLTISSNGVQRNYNVGVVVWH
jgi:hypothetical protein